jgi:hypothetical protein
MTARRARGCLVPSTELLRRRLGAAVEKAEVMGRTVGNSAMPTAVAQPPPVQQDRHPGIRGWRVRNRRLARTVGMNSWSSGSWRTSPTRRRSAQVRLDDGQAVDADLPADGR